MAIPIRLILLICVLETVRADYPEEISPQQGRPGGRFPPRPIQKNPQSQLINTNQRIRRPNPQKVRLVNVEKTEPPTFAARGPRPIFTQSPKESSTAAPQPPQQDQPIKPVSEDNEDEENVAQAIANLGAVSTFSPQSGNLVGGPLTPKPEPPQQVLQYRPTQSPQIFLPKANHPEQNIQPIQYRPQKPIKLRKNVEEVQEVRVAAKPVQLPLRKSYKSEYGPREKKPVAQIIRRWREQDPDGSITWGFENDDGSYKEEFIGIDCITRGKYGYIDPDGLRREYTYETGHKCDDEQEQEDENGFVDYQENKLVLPNGKTIDLSKMGKKQSRRPQPVYRN